MSKPIIKVENISKCYLIGHEAQQGDFKYKRFSEAVLAPFRQKGKFCFIAEIPPILNLGRYTCSVGCGQPNVRSIEEHPFCLSFHVELFNNSGSHLGACRGGIVAPEVIWERK